MPNTRPDRLGDPPPRPAADRSPRSRHSDSESTDNGIRLASGVGRNGQDDSGALLRHLASGGSCRKEMVVMALTMGNANRRCDMSTSGCPWASPSPIALKEMSTVPAFPAVSARCSPGRGHRLRPSLPSLPRRGCPPPLHRAWRACDRQGRLLRPRGRKPERPYPRPIRLRHISPHSCSRATPGSPRAGKGFPLGRCRPEKLNGCRRRLSLPRLRS